MSANKLKMNAKKTQIPISNTNNKLKSVCPSSIKLMISLRGLKSALAFKY